MVDILLVTTAGAINNCSLEILFFFSLPQALLLWFHYYISITLIGQVSKSSRNSWLRLPIGPSFLVKKSSFRVIIITSKVVCFQDYHFCWKGDPCLTQMLMKISTPYQMAITLDDYALLVKSYMEFEGIIQIKRSGD